MEGTTTPSPGSREEPTEAPAGTGPVRPGVAAFDFDGTLSVRDTMVPFLVRTHGWPRMARAALRSAPRVRADGSGWRNGLKVATVGRLFRGMHHRELERLGREYAATLGDLLRPTMVERVRWHQDQGHATVIVSASLATYLRPVAADLGLDDVLAVELAAGGDGVLTGTVEGGANTRGAHKVTRLREWITVRMGPDAEVELWAYGDSSGDHELLAAADHPTWVRPPR